MLKPHGKRCGVLWFLGLLALLSGLLFPFRAGAADSGWPLARASDVTLAFGAAYAGADGRSSTHRGADIAGDAGDEVVAPSPGEVRFVGRVPASAGGTQLAVTILRSDGVTLTFMPLDSACVAAGESVSAGQRIASLARDGDASSAETHLHMGAKRGDLYVDPMAFLVPPVPATAAPVAEPAPAAPAEPAERPAAASPPVPEPVEAPVAVPAGEPVPVAATTGVVLEAGSGVEARSAATAADAPVLTAPLGASEQVGVGAIAQSAPVGHYSPAAGTSLFAPLALHTPLAATAVDAAGAGSVAALQAQGAGLPAVGAVAAAPARGLAEDAIPSPALRMPSASAVASAARQLGHAWLVALLGTLVAAAALWPLWRRPTQPHEEEPRCRISPEGTQVAAAAGR